MYLWRSVFAKMLAVKTIAARTSVAKQFLFIIISPLAKGHVAALEIYFELQPEPESTLTEDK